MIPKFRAWWIQDEVMTHIDTLEFLQGGIRVSDGCWHEKFLGDEVILMQSTGLKDKNGVEIFEGDIVHRKVHLVLFGSDLNKWIDEYACVEWKYGGWHVGEDLLDLILDEGVDRHTLCRQTAIEIAGNIYENPKLLEVEG